MSKIYIGMITSNGNLDNLLWLNECATYFDGLAIVYHGNRDDGFILLDKNKGDGFIVEREFYQHHAHSMNDFLLNPKIRPGSWILLRDSAEQVNPDFARNIKLFIQELERNGINTVYQYSKCLLFKKFEHQQFNCSPHWGLSNAQGKFLEIDKQKGFQNPETYCYSNRNKIRPVDNFINHFVKYYLYDSSNHLLLGRESKQQEFLLHEEVRYKFKSYCENKLNINLTFHDLKDFILKNELDYELKYYFNFEPILNDFYCYHKLGHKIEDILDRHKTNKLFKID